MCKGSGYKELHYTTEKDKEKALNNIIKED